MPLAEQLSGIEGGAIEAVCELNHDLMRRNRPHQRREGSNVIGLRRTQSFGDGLIAEEVSDLREGWMKHADVVLTDEDVVAAVYEALAMLKPDRRGN
jgi:hypothetical protein